MSADALAKKAVVLLQPPKNFIYISVVALVVVVNIVLINQKAFITIKKHRD